MKQIKLIDKRLIVSVIAFSISFCSSAILYLVGLDMKLEVNYTTNSFLQANQVIGLGIATIWISVFATIYGVWSTKQFLDNSSIEYTLTMRLWTYLLGVGIIVIILLCAFVYTIFSLGVV